LDQISKFSALCSSFAPAERAPRRVFPRGAATDVKTAANSGGLPKEVFDGLQAQLAANRWQFYRDLPAGPFYGFNRPAPAHCPPGLRNWCCLAEIDSRRSGAH
jgi:hypothetical protein